ncbi:MAG: hypothetical protein R2911_31215 [Caldilineaceae bacterium]
MLSKQAAVVEIIIINQRAETVNGFAKRGVIAQPCAISASAAQSLKRWGSISTATVAAT